MLATPADVEARLERQLTSGELSQMDALLADVSSAVQIRTGQKFVRAEHQLRTRVKRGVVRLPQRPVHDVGSVTDRFGNDISFEWDGLDRVHVRTVRTGRAPLQVVDVTYDAGYDDPPPAIVGVVCAIALRSLGVDPTETSIRQEQIDGYQYTVGGTGSGRAYGVLPDEAEILRRFTRPYGTIQAAW